VDAHDEYHGMARERVARAFRDADVFIDYGSHGSCTRSDDIAGKEITVHEDWIGFQQRDDVRSLAAGRGDETGIEWCSKPSGDLPEHRRCSFRPLCEERSVESVEWSQPLRSLCGRNSMQMRDPRHGGVQRRLLRAQAIHRHGVIEAFEEQTQFLRATGGTQGLWDALGSELARASMCRQLVTKTTGETSPIGPFHGPRQAVLGEDPERRLSPERDRDRLGRIEFPGSERGRAAKIVDRSVIESAFAYCAFDTVTIWREGHTHPSRASAVSTPPVQLTPHLAWASGSASRITRSDPHWARRIVDSDRVAVLRQDPADRLDPELSTIDALLALLVDETHERGYGSVKVARGAVRGDRAICKSNAESEELRRLIGGA
jgi:hypothetical protein